MKQDLVRWTCDRCGKWIEKAGTPDYCPPGWRIARLLELDASETIDQDTQICPACRIDVSRYLRTPPPVVAEETEPEKVDA